MTMRPHIGEVVGLVYRECPCGEWCATGEGAIAPRCACCGERMWPLGTQSLQDGGPRFGQDHAEQRRIRSLGFVAFFTNEIAGFGLVARVRQLLGIGPAFSYRSDPLPYATHGEVDPRPDAP